jgi:hypothetical protein
LYFHALTGIYSYDERKRALGVTGSAVPAEQFLHRSAGFGFAQRGAGLGQLAQQGGRRENLPSSFWFLLSFTL